jgi:nucleotide-binding universal stress UspA family protein
MKILLPIDGSQHALAAVRYAIHLTTQGLRANFVLANVQEPVQLYEVLLTLDPQVLDQASHAAGVDALHSAQSLLKGAGLVFESEIAAGPPGNTLLAIIERFDCKAVIMSSRATGSLRDALLGSVSHTLLHDCPVPVMLVKPESEISG